MNRVEIAGSAIGEFTACDSDSESTENFILKGFHVTNSHARAPR
jgi:hypothetical protein